MQYDGVETRRDHRRPLKGPFLRVEPNVWIAMDVAPGGDDAVNRFRSTLCLYEGNSRLTAAHQSSVAMRLGGGGRYAHWNHSVWFTTTDGSDPNTNRRRYAFDFSLSTDEWSRARIARSQERWLKHPQGMTLLERGGRGIPPPLTVNLGLTNKCNLRCEICGSQKHLDRAGVRRRHMDFATFSAVCETLFPVVAEVELNSQGDPLLYPQIDQVLDSIAMHGCETKIQHNGTLLSPEMIERLLQLHGTIMLSLDAVGERFDEVRSGGVWSKAHVGIERLLAARDPTRLSIGIYPTITQRTIGNAIDIVEWSADHGVDHVNFHRYSPVQDSWERPPDDAAYERVRDDLRRWSDDRSNPIKLQFENASLNTAPVRDRKFRFADPLKAAWLFESGTVMFPTAAGQAGASARSICAAPDEYLEISLDGEMSACCRSQDVKLGRATSVDAFADAWFGNNYALIRQSLLRGTSGPYPLPNCAECIRFFDPTEAHDRAAVDYSVVRNLMQESDAVRLQIRHEGAIPIETIQKEAGACHIATFPLGIPDNYRELREDDRALPLSDALHDDIRNLGRGRYHVGSNSVYFSTTDGTDARRNGRIYTLHPVTQSSVRCDHDQRYAYCVEVGYEQGSDDVAVSPLRLFEDEYPLGPAHATHQDVRTVGGGRYSHWHGRLWFSSSDNSDPRSNGRRYSIEMNGVRTDLNLRRATEVSAT
jgi:MoaA/NifB/PqqE/SkfB family radical SAM enzyme